MPKKARVQDQIAADGHIGRDLVRITLSRESRMADQPGYVLQT
jgi:hypothetical protein